MSRKVAATLPLNNKSFIITPLFSVKGVTGGFLPTTEWLFTGRKKPFFIIASGIACRALWRKSLHVRIGFFATDYTDRKQIQLLINDPDEFLNSKMIINPKRMCTDDPRFSGVCVNLY